MNHVSLKSILTCCAALLLAGCAASHGTTVVFSNLVPASAGQTQLLTDSTGTPLASGSWMRLGYFENRGVADIKGLAQQGAAPLLAAFTPFGEASVIGIGADSEAGRFEIAGSAPATQARDKLHVVVFNAPSPWAATEVCVAELPGSVPPDDPSGLVGYLAVHQENATPVVGETSAMGLATEAIATGYGAWLATQQLGGLPAGRLLPGADADDDGVTNLVEYALGSHAGDASSRANTAFAPTEGGMRLSFLGRNDNAALHLIVETSTRLEADDWSETPNPAVVVASPPSPAPDGYAWYEIVLPAGDTRQFARVRVTLTP